MWEVYFNRENALQGTQGEVKRIRATISHFLSTKSIVYSSQPQMRLVPLVSGFLSEFKTSIEIILKHGIIKET